jgi:cell fate regulator YaaT (PSP1 superfamily)
MIEIIGIRFKPVGKIYYFDPCGLDIQKGMHVIVETVRGIEYGTVVIGRKETNEKNVVQPLKKVIRIATPQDQKTFEANRIKQKKAVEVCNEKIRAHNLKMKLIDVEYTFDGGKILFYFTADGRVDFRELVKDLASIFKTRIELRQIGVRDEAKMIGSCGICGRPLCCTEFLGEFIPVSIKMAKEQGLSLNPTKISGTCGRLMCCLKYEQEAYDALLKKTPAKGSLVKTPEGNGTVEFVSLLKGLLKVRIEKEKEVVLKEFSVDDVTVLRNGSSKNSEPIDEEVVKILEEEENL